MLARLVAAVVLVALLAGCSSEAPDGGAKPAPGAATEPVAIEVWNAANATEDTTPPTGWFAATATAGAAPMTTVFSWDGTDSGPGTLSWSFDPDADDGEWSYGEHFPFEMSHTYRVPGTYRATLELVDGAWAATYELWVNVTASWGAQVPWGGLDATVRPGASLGGYCTFNFLFNDTLGRAYIGTAGHCTEEVGEEVEEPFAGMVGTVVFDSDVTEGADPAVDFALIELYADIVAKANPTMIGHEGPTAAAPADVGQVGDLVSIHGHGILLGDNEATRSRQGVITANDGRMYNIDMPAVNGDSGSPILHLDTGMAFGIISHYGFGALPPTTDEGPTMAFILEELHKAGFDVQVAAAQG